MTLAAKARSPCRPPIPHAVEAIAAFGRFASARGWVAATSGNFSCRLDAAHALVTRSGIDKGAIGAADVAVVPLAGPIPAGMSAETPLHLARYRASAGDRRDRARAHDRRDGALARGLRARATCASAASRCRRRCRGSTTHEGVVDLPVFANDQDTVALAAAIEARLER